MRARGLYCPCGKFCSSVYWEGFAISSATPDFKSIIEAFGLKGEIFSCSKLTRGHINDTYCVDMMENGEIRSYLVQRVNHHVFKAPEDIMENVEAVTGHIRTKLSELGESDIKRKVLKIYRTLDGKSLFVDGEGNYWRVISFVYNAKCFDDYSVGNLIAIGHGFGRFLALLSDFPGEGLHEIIKGFHDTPARFNALFDAAERDPLGRAASVKEELDYLASVRPLASRFDELHAEGVLPYRVTHNDTKGNNIMIDSESGEPLAVIDLDTVMPGYAMNDFGDAVRYAANTAAEDERDLSKVSLDLEKYEALAKGFLPEMQGRISDAEMENMPWGALLMTLELTARFLTDYLEGDRYFKTAREGHNLDRARCQLALAKDMQAKFDKMVELTRKHSGC